MPFRGVPNTPQSSEWCENCAKRNWETIEIPVKILFMSTCMNKSMVSQQNQTTEMTCIVVDKNTVRAKPHSIFFTTILKITKEIFVKIFWQLKTPTRTWKCMRCIMQMSYCTRQTFLSKTFASRSTCRGNKKTLFGKRVMKRTHCR